MKNNLLKFTNIVLLITMIAIILVAGTYAKYTSSASGTDATVVANWSFEVNGQDITILGDEETITFGLFSTIYDSDGKTAETDVATGADKNLIAPGTSGSFEFKVQNTSDVTAQYAIDFTVTNANNIPIEYSTDGTTWTKELADIVASNDTILAIGSGEKAITVQWRWAFSGDDTFDTNLATLETAPTITVEASITATQLNNGANAGEIVMLNGDGQTYYTLAPSTLSFRSSANIGDFQEVQINGETIDPSNYTMTEGSTIINLSIDYLKTLAEDDYSISIVSKTGSPSAGFSVIEPDINSHGFYYNQPYTAYVDYFNDNCSFFIREDGTLDATVGVSVETCSYTVDGKDMTVTSTTFGTLNCTISDDGTTIYCAELAANFVLGDESTVADENYIYIYDSSYDGYKVMPIDKSQESYGPIRTGIYEKPTVLFTFNAFENCRNLTSMYIPGFLKGINDRSLRNCTNLTSVTIGVGIEFFDSEIFNGCNSLTTITYEGTMEQWNAISKVEGSPTTVNWNDGSAITTIKCSDGTITL